MTAFLTKAKTIIFATFIICNKCSAISDRSGFLEIIHAANDNQVTYHKDNADYMFSYNNKLSKNSGYIQSPNYNIAANDNSFVQPNLTSINKNQRISPTLNQEVVKNQCNSFLTLR